MRIKTCTILVPHLFIFTLNFFRVNIEILGTLLRQGTAHNEFEYVTYIMNILQEENLKVNEVFLKHLATFNAKCAKNLEDKVSICYCLESFHLLITFQL